MSDDLCKRSGDVRSDDVEKPEPLVGSVTEAERSVLVFLLDALRIAKHEQYRLLLNVVDKTDRSDRFKHYVKRLRLACDDARLAEEAERVREELR